MGCSSSSSPAETRGKEALSGAHAAKIPLRPMGCQGMMASMQGYGCMGLTAFYGAAVDDDKGLEVLEKALELGITHFDTAEIYRGKDAQGNPKTNEELLGKFATKVGRDKLTIATKFMPPEHGDKATIDVVRGALTASLGRLALDCVDLYYLHRIPSDEYLRDWMTAAKEMVDEGKCKYVGVSEATAAQIRMAHAIHPLTAVQQEWSLLIRNLEAEIVPTCRELGIAVIAYSPLCRGFTSALVKKEEDWAKIGNEGGAAKGFQAMCPHLTGENMKKNAALLGPLEEAAKEHGVTPAQLSLAWVHAQGDNVFPIPGTTKIANLTSNVAAAGLALSIDAGVFKRIGDSVDASRMEGDRYPEALQRSCFEAKK